MDQKELIERITELAEENKKLTEENEEYYRKVIYFMKENRKLLEEKQELYERIKPTSPAKQGGIKFKK